MALGRQTPATIIHRTLKDHPRSVFKVVSVALYIIHRVLVNTDTRLREGCAQSSTLLAGRRCNNARIGLGPLGSDASARGTPVVRYGNARNQRRATGRRTCYSTSYSTAVVRYSAQPRTAQGRNRARGSFSCLLYRLASLFLVFRYVWTSTLPGYRASSSEGSNGDVSFVRTGEGW